MGRMMSDVSELMIAVKAVAILRCRQGVSGFWTFQGTE